MAKKKSTTKTPAPVPTPDIRPGVTPERFSRLYKLVQFLGDGPKRRDQLTAHLGLDVRGFYRDLEVLRACGIEVNLQLGKYALTSEVESAVAQLPYPDPHLTLGEMRQLARGKSATHRKIQDQLSDLQSS